VVPGKVLAARAELLVNGCRTALPSSSLNKSRADLPAKVRATCTRVSSRTVMAP
jgi:hypothetical protein